MKRGGKKEALSFGGSGKVEVGGEELMRKSALAAASVSNDELSGGNVDPRLLDDLQNFLPMLESFLDQDQKESSRFTGKGKVVYTKTPTKDSVLKKANNQNGRRTSQSIPTRGRSILGDSDRNEDGGADCSSTLSEITLEAEKDREEISALNKQLEELCQNLLKKEELVSAAVISRNQLTSAKEELKEKQNQLRGKGSLLKGFERQVSDAKTKLAERRAVLEKIQWEATTSNNQVEKLQEDLKTAELEMSAFNLLIEALKDNTAAYAEIDDMIPHRVINTSVIDDIDELDLQKIEEARKAYVAAVEAVKEYQDEDSLVAAASARLYLESLVM